MWNEKFSREGFLYGKEPNAFLAANEHLLRPKSKVLMLGEGEGRTACYMALKGHVVTALDASDVGLDKTRELAKEADLIFTSAGAVENRGLFTCLRHFGERRLFYG
jgi:SAM-dependent methyltransferase